METMLPGRQGWRKVPSHPPDAFLARSGEWLGGDLPGT